MKSDGSGNASWGVWRLLWGIWKWLLHCLTGHCELYRICKAASPLHRKTSALVQSLKASRTQSLKKLPEEVGIQVSVEEAWSTICEVKRLKEAEQREIKSQLEACLERVGGVRKLWKNVEEMRVVQYNQEDHTHEELLMKLWANLEPEETLSSRIGLQWQQIGFQGNNPATDFRGMGLLGLRSLLYFSEEHQDRARSVLQHSKHPQFWYPLSVTGIDLCSVMYDWLKTEALDSYLILTCSQWPPPTSLFLEMTSCVLCRFDEFWLNKEPENIMAYPRLKEEFLLELRQQLLSGKPLTLEPHSH